MTFIQNARALPDLIGDYVVGTAIVMLHLWRAKRIERLGDKQVALLQRTTQKN